MQYLVNTTVLSTWVRCTNKTKAEKIKHIQLRIALDSVFFFYHGKKPDKNCNRCFNYFFIFNFILFYFQTSSFK